MELNELNMLEVIHKHDYISQRDISNEVGISLGMVNLLLKKFIKVGIIKAEKLTGNKVKYILTSDGISFLSNKTVDFVARSYQAVLKIQSHISDVIFQNYELGEVVYIYGLHDEIGNMLVDVLKKNGYTFHWITNPDDKVKFIQWHDSEGEGIFLFKLTVFKT
jgi:predicted transcriptional regulator